MTKVFITGVSGFVGSGLVRFLETLETIQLYGHSRDEDKARKQFVNNKIILVEEYTNQKSDELEIDMVIHLAGIAHDLSNHYKEEDYFKINYEGTVRIVNEFMKSKATKLIFLSSIKAAVDVSSTSVNEDILPNPVTPYGISKRKAEEYIQALSLPRGKKIYVFRPCMIHGQGNKGNLNLLYKFIKRGLPYPLGAFHNQRSFLSLDNFTFIVKHFIDKPLPSGIYHLSDDGYLSTTELYKTIAAALGKKARVLTIPVGGIQLLFSLLRKGQMLNKLTENMMVSNSKVVNAIGEPLPLDVHSGIKKTIQSFHA
jgi:nucleoside-diphosphate-sugar epimerase